MERLFLILSALALSGVILLAVVPESSVSGEPPVIGRIISRAESDTGATNLVSAIYLGYRAYDTLGEALVLLLAVTGVYYFARDGEG